MSAPKVRTSPATPRNEAAERYSPAIAEAFIRSHDGAQAAFKGLYGFPGSVCISVNEEIVHGIPSKKRVLKEGDIVSLDFGVKLEGMYTDAAITVPVGHIDDTTQRLLDVTQRGLAAGVAAALPDNHVGDIGAAIQEIVEPGLLGGIRVELGDQVIEGTVASRLDEARRLFG